jgi:hypothetical protein
MQELVDSETIMSSRPYVRICITRIPAPSPAWNVYLPLQLEPSAVNLPNC